MRAARMPSHSSALLTMLGRATGAQLWGGPALSFAPSDSALDRESGLGSLLRHDPGDGLQSWTSSVVHLQPCVLSLDMTP